MEVAIVVDAVCFFDLLDLDAFGVEAFLLEFLLVYLLLLLRLLGILLPQPVNHLHLNDKSPKIINHQPPPNHLRHKQLQPQHIQQQIED